MDASPTDEDTAATRAPRARTLGVVLGVSALVGLAVAGLVYSVIALPLYVLAQADPDGLDRPFIRRGFLVVALPAGVLVGLGAGLAVGTWYRRGGRLPTDRTDYHDR
jgi:hypothetical protein